MKGSIYFILLFIVTSLFNFINGEKEIGHLIQDNHNKDISWKDAGLLGITFLGIMLVVLAGISLGHCIDILYYKIMNITILCVYNLLSKTSYYNK